MLKDSLYLWVVITVLMFSKSTSSQFLKRGYMDPGKCESFCLSSGFQGSVGSCNCGYIMFSKRSGPSPHHHIDKVEDDTEMIKLQAEHLMTELSTEEILEALEILERVNSSKEEDYINQLSDKEFKLLLWMVNWMDINNY